MASSRKQCGNGLDLQRPGLCETRTLRWEGKGFELSVPLARTVNLAEGHAWSLPGWR
jgi:hypothetical protein